MPLLFDNEVKRIIKSVVFTICTNLKILTIFLVEIWPLANL